MSRYIDADALIEQLKSSSAYNDYEWAMYADGFIEDIENAPSIDIVRCKECKWRGEQTESGIPYYWCRLVGVGYEVPIEHYCSYGERREQ